MEQIVTVSPKALAEINRLLAEQNNPDMGLRLGVKGGGCSGLSYVIDLGTPTPKDLIQEIGGVRILIDPRSSLYLKGSELDYSGGLQDRGFKFKNPNAQNTCGCGESFSV